MDLETLMVILPNSYFAEEGIKSQKPGKTCASKYT